MQIKETMFAYPLGFYVTQMHTFHMDAQETTLSKLLHNRLGHPRTSMFHKIMKSTQDISPKVHPTHIKTPCLACSQGKLVLRPSISKTIRILPKFLEQLHANACGPIEPPSRPFCFS